MLAAAASLLDGLTTLELEYGQPREVLNSKSEYEVGATVSPFFLVNSNSVLILAYSKEVEVEVCVWRNVDFDFKRVFIEVNDEVCLLQNALEAT